MSDIAIASLPENKDKHQKGSAPMQATMPSDMLGSDYEKVRKIRSEYSNAWEAQKQESDTLISSWKMAFGAAGEQWDDEAREYKSKRDERAAQYNIIKQKLKTYTGMIIADEYDFKYDPMNGGRTTGVEGLETAYYCDKEVCQYDENYNLMIEDGAIHLGILEMGTTNKYDPRGNICFKRAIPGRWVIDPYWKTDDDRDCMRAWKQGNMTLKQLEDTFKNLPPSNKLDAERARLKSVGMAWDSADMTEYNMAFPTFRNAFHVVEEHWVEIVHKKRLYAKNNQGQLLPFPVSNDNALLEKFARENGITDWKEGNAFVAPYDDRIHWSAIICPELWPFKLLEYGKPEIQPKGLPIIQFTLGRDIAGRNSGMVADLIDPQKDINYAQSKKQELLANALGGATTYDKRYFPNEEDQEDFEKNHNDPTRAFGVEGNPTTFASNLKDGPINQGLYASIGESFDFADRLSGVSAAMQSQTEGANEPASLFAMKLKVNKIGTLTVDKRVRRVRERMAEMYFFQAPITYSSERSFTSRDGKRTTILNESLGGGYVRNSVKELPRCSVAISESENNLTKQMRDKTDLGAILETTPPEYRETIAIGIGELIKTTSIPEDQKGAMEESLMIERVKARLASITEIKGSDSMGKQAELTGLQAQTQIDRMIQTLERQQQAGQGPQEMITQQPQAVGGDNTATVPDMPADQPTDDITVNTSEPLGE